MCTAIVSALTRIPIRCDLAMTGEITLRGKVLPIGGVKEKVLAAHRVGIRTVLLPKDNEKDLADVPPEIQADLVIQFVETMDEVLALALERPLQTSALPEVAAEVVTKFETEKDQELTN
jgi:ATP-dependent Lon protease